MRPKKVILVVSSNESILSQTAYCLHINGYKPLKAASGQEAITIFCSAPVIDLVISDMDMPQINGRQLVERLKRIKNYTPMMLVSNGSLTSEVHFADAMVLRNSCSTEEFLEKIKVMSQRKRGPRKGCHRVIPEQAAIGAPRTEVAECSSRLVEGNQGHMLKRVESDAEFEARLCREESEARKIPCPLESCRADMGQTCRTDAGESRIRHCRRLMKARALAEES